MAYINTEQYDLFRQIPLAPGKIKVSELYGEKYPPARVEFLLREAARFDHEYVLAPDGVGPDCEVSLTEEGQKLVGGVTRYNKIEPWAPLIMFAAIAFTIAFMVWAGHGFPGLRG